MLSEPYVNVEANINDNLFKIEHICRRHMGVLHYFHITKAKKKKKENEIILNRRCETT